MSTFVLTTTVDRVTTTISDPFVGSDEQAADRFIEAAATYGVTDLDRDSLLLSLEWDGGGGVSFQDNGRLRYVNVREVW